MLYPITYQLPHLYSFTSLQRYKNTAHIICFGTKQTQALKEKLPDEAIVKPPMYQGTIERFWDDFYAIYLLFHVSIYNTDGEKCIKSRTRLYRQNTI